jgi:hypothetical protein
MVANSSTAKQKGIRLASRSEMMMMVIIIIDSAHK